jgi:hypothetical protein
MLRIFRDAFNIFGSTGFDAHGQIVGISLNQAHMLAARFIDALPVSWPAMELSPICARFS